ncbi:MAG: cytochrome c oxidase assembly protein [Solirubrobacteraceae bacterium]|nr:cytochrome c oxidase assembly protein [Patulibacter sp.]
MSSVLASVHPGNWSSNPAPLLFLGPIVYFYVKRWRAVHAHPFRLVLFSIGILAACAAFFSPIDTLGDRQLSMHMIQHLLLLDIAPVFCILGLTKQIFRPATKRIIRIEKHSPWIMNPRLGLGIYVIGMWFWHMPWMYDAAVRNSWVHVGEHLTFTVAGGLYWWHLISPVRDKRQLSGMGAVMYMATTKVTIGILGLALTFIPRPIYPVYENQPNIFHLSSSEDQGLAGVIMATEQSIVMGLALVFLVTQAIERSEQEQRRKEFIEDRAAAKAAELAAASAGPTPGAGLRELY